MRVVRPLLLATALSLSLATLSPLAAFAQLDDSQLPAGQAGHQGTLPYTTYGAEFDAATNKLYCKWTSQDGRDGAGRYDFLCVGGNWATVHLMLDKSHNVANGLSRVRLLWSEWPAAHPASSENVVAQQFLQYVADRFLAPKLAPEVMQSFFGSRARDWQNGDVRIHYELTDENTHRLHRLEIIGLGSSLKLPHVTTSNSFDKKLNTWPANTENEPIAVPPVLPTPPQDRLPLQFPPQHEDSNFILPISRPQPAVPQPATPADVGTQPAPESLIKPVAAPATPNPALVPNDANTVTAPTNFDTYNKAEALTKDVEKKAFGSSATLPAKAVPTVQSSGGLVKPEANKLVVPPVVAVPTPQVSSTQSPVPSPQPPIGPVKVISPANPNLLEGEGLGSPSTTPAESKGDMTDAQKAAQKAGKYIDTPSTVAPWDQPVPTGASRPLPQLKFIPKAQPLNQPVDQTIQFEDEKSQL